MTAAEYGSRWQPKNKCSRNASSLEDDYDRSTCSGTEASEDEGLSRTSSTRISVHSPTVDSQGRKLGQQLLGLLKTGDVPAQAEAPPPPPPPPPPPLPARTKLHSGASLFIPKSAQSQAQSWELASQTQAQCNAYTVNNQNHTPAFDKEGLCWEYMHHGFCPRQSTCRWMHPPAESYSNWDSTYASAPVDAFVSENTFAQVPYQAQTVFPQACPVNMVTLDSSYNQQISSATDLQSQIASHAQMCEMQFLGSSDAKPPSSLPLVDVSSQSGENFGVSGLHDPEDDTPLPNFMMDFKLQTPIPQATSRPESAPVSKIAQMRAPQKKSWADIQEDSDNDEADLCQW